MFSRGFLSFPLGELTGTVSRINSATLQTLQCRLVFPRPLCGDFDEELPLRVASTGQKSLQVTRKVQDDWGKRQDRGLRSQFRLRFEQDITYDNTNDYVNIVTREATAFWPYLAVEYEYEEWPGGRGPAGGSPAGAPPRRFPGRPPRATADVPALACPGCPWARRGGRALSGG